MGIPIILDTDIGTDVDDAFALAMAVREPEIELLGVTTVYGDVSLRARMARKLLNLLGRPDIPVAAGLGQPLHDGKNLYWGGWEGKGFLTPADTDLPYDPRPGVDLMRDLILQSSEKVTLVGIGPLTNLGVLIRDYPDCHPKIKEIILMAGSLAEKDEEWNVQCDPEAARILLTSDLPIKLGTRHFVNQPWLTQDDRAKLAAEGDDVVQVLVRLFDTFLSHKTRTHSPMYDPVTLSMAFTDQFLPTETRSIHIKIENHILYTEISDPADETAHEIAVPRAVHPGPFIQYLVNLLLS